MIELVTSCCSETFLHAVSLLDTPTLMTIRLCRRGNELIIFWLKQKRSYFPTGRIICHLNSCLIFLLRFDSSPNSTLQIANFQLKVRFVVFSFFFAINDNDFSKQFFTSVILYISPVEYIFWRNSKDDHLLCTRLLLLIC